MEVKGLGNSVIWNLQEQYFAEAGIEAWQRGEVPHYVTSNPMIAKTYAEIVFAFLCDLSGKKLPGEKVYIIELGAGHGRFCYHFLKHLDQLISHCYQVLPQFCYILSDFSENMLDYWIKHPRLQHYFENGSLDCCLLNAKEVDTIHLRKAETSIAKSLLGYPLIIIANYFFDTIPQEVYYISDNKVHGCEVTVSLPPDAPERSAKDILSEILISGKPAELLRGPYSRQPFIDDILVGQAEQLNSDTYVLFPDTGLACIDALNRFSRDGALLLTADRGYYHISELENCAFPNMAIHSSFSYPVNYPALIDYCAYKGGESFFPAHRPNSIVVGCLLMVNDHLRFLQTKLNCHRFLGNFNPDDFFTLKNLFVTNLSKLELSEILSGIRLSDFDARLFLQLSSRMRQLIQAGLSENEKWDVFQVIHRIWEMYYPLGGEEDLAFTLGEFLFLTGFAREALSYFRLSETVSGNAANKRYNIAVCHYASNETSEALSIARENHANYPAHTETSLFLTFLEGLP